MADKFARDEVLLDSPADNGAEVEPLDDTDLVQVTRYLYVGENGDVAVTLKSGANVVFANVQSGTILPVRVSRVANTNTTANSIVALW